MNFEQMELKKLLDDELALLLKSVEVLNYSLNKCHSIGLKNSYSMEELIQFESLSGRFARTSDILTQKILKTLFMVIQEDARFFIDRCNLAEKMGLVSSAEELYLIRKLRNDIAHEYCLADISEIFSPLLKYSETLLRAIETTNTYIEHLNVSN